MDVRTVVAAELPQYRIDSVVPVGGGTDHAAYEVNGELIVRFRTALEPDRFDRELRLLAALAEISPLPVPQPAFTVPELGCMAYPKLAGTPLLDLALPDRRHVASIAAALGEFLTALHAVPTARVGNLVEVDDQPLTEWRREAAATYPTVAGRIPAPYRRHIEAFLAAPPPDAAYVPVFSHNDLGIEHVLVDPVMWTVTGIIDWSDAAIVDPAYDFGLLFRDLGPAALRTVIGGYRTTPREVATVPDRAVFYARCSVIEDLAYGLETGRDPYVQKSLVAMEWLFPTAGRPSIL